MTTPAFKPSHGSKAEVYYNGYDLSVYMSSATSGSERDKADASTFKTTTKRYTVGLSEVTMALEGFIDSNRDQVDGLMDEALMADEGVFTHFPAGASLGAIGKSMLAVETKYEITSEMGNTVGMSIEASAGISGVADNVKALVFEQEVTEAGMSEQLDFGAAINTKFGSLHVHGLTTGDSMVITLQDSADGTTFADIADVTFDGGTEEEPLRAGMRVVSENALRRYARIIWTGAGTIIIAAVARTKS